MNKILILGAMVFALSVASPMFGQESADAANAETSQQSELVVDLVQDQLQEKIGEKIDDVSETVNENEQAQQASASILKKIYEAAEYMSFSWFHWLAFALMVAGLVSFALQLVLGKLFMLMQFHFSLTEIMADGLGFAVSAIGLILTTQAATENSTFTQSPALVLSAAAVGAFFGLIFYVRGQTQEFREAREVRRRKNKS